MKSNPLALEVWRQPSVARDLSLVFGGAAILALSAQVQIPFYPVPFTLQTMAVLLIGLTFGAKRSFAAALVYVLLGAAGLPIYAGLAGGYGHLLGATGGYLVAMPLAAALLGWASEKGLCDSPLKAAASLAVCEGFIFLLGISVLSLFIGLKAAVITGGIVFLPSEVLKAVLAGMSVSIFRRASGVR